MNLMYEYSDEASQSYAYDGTGIMQSGTDTYLKDGHGSILAKYDSTGKALSSTDYDAYGNLIYGEQADPFGYCGEYRDSESGLIYLRNRYYDSATGRFITEDPAKDGTNWYSYCAGNPVTMVDPLGLKYYDFDARESDIEEGMKTDPVAVIENEEYIEIKVNMSFIGDYESTIEGTDISFKDAIIEGINDAWNGMFDYKEVRVTVNDVTNQNCNSIVVNVDKSLNASNASKKDIYIYAGDNRSNYTYTYNDIKLVAGHEFGHVLGIHDIYDDPIYPMLDAFPSIMCNVWVTNKATNLDYHMMYLAQKEYNETENLLRYSEKSDIMSSWVRDWRVYINRGVAN